jgi:ribosomal protein S18 acetylase RimI-like enzyme
MAGRSPIDRATTALRRNGFAGTMAIGGRRMRGVVHLAEEHVWYGLSLGGELPSRPLPDGFELIRATLDDLALAAQVDKEPQHAAEVLAAGHDLWLVRSGDRAAFSCWTYRGSAPALAARGGWFALPPGTVCMEDSVTNPEFRGMGIAPAAWVGLAEALAADGVQTIVTKVAVDNVPSRKACEKAGFQEIAIMHLRRLGLRRRVSFDEIRGKAGKLLVQSFLA